MRPARSALILAAAVTAVTATGVTPAATARPPSGPAATGADAAAKASAVQSEHTLTLVTGDVVHLTTLPGGRQAAVVDPERSPSKGGFMTSEQDGDLFVIPTEALPYVQSGQVDRNLFNLSTLVEQGFDDAHAKTLPLLVAAAPARAGAGVAPARVPATPRGARRGIELPSLAAVAVTTDKSNARTFWESLGTRGTGPGGRAAGPNGSATPTLTGGIGRVWLDGRVRASLSESVPQIGAPAAWKAGYDGRGVKVAVLDTGYDPTHPDLSGRVGEARNFTEDASTTDGFGHGTHVAATIAGSGAASDGKRRGVAPGAQLMVGKVLDDTGSGLDSWVIAGMEWAAGQGAQVINMSLGGAPTDGTDPLSQAVDALTEQTGALFVIAAGNMGPQEQMVGSPGTATSALTVGAVDKQDVMASTSSRGPRLGDAAIKPDVVAPGVDIVAARAAGTSLGDVVDARYASLSGTSMATPHVAGAAAILAQEHPDWDADELKSALVATSHHLSGPGVAEQGTGRVDVAAATTQQVFPSAGSLALGRIAWTGDRHDPVTRTVSYRNDSRSAVTLDLVADARDTGAAPQRTAALSVTPRRLTVQPGQSATATVTLDPNATAPGTYAGYLTASTGMGKNEVTLRSTIGFAVDGPLHDLTVNVLDRNGNRPGDITYFQMWNLDTGELEQAAIFGEGTRTYTVPAGRYSLMTYIPTVDADGTERERTFMGNPELTVTGDTTVDLDARTAHEFTFDVPDPVEAPGYTLAWRRTAGNRSLLIGFNLAGRTKVSAGSTKPVRVGTFDFYSRWDLVAPVLTMRAGGTGGFTSTAPQPVAGSALLDGTAQLPLVDAGFGRPEDFAGVDARGAAVLLRAGDFEAGTNAPYQLANAAAAGARLALIAPDQRGLFGDAAPDAPIAGYTMTRLEGQQLRALMAAKERPVIDFTGVPESPYHYDLMLAEPGGVPADLAYGSGELRLAQVNSEFHAQSDQMKSGDTWLAYPDGVNVAFSQMRFLTPPMRRVDYLSTRDTTWIHSAMADTWDRLGTTYGLAKKYKPGRATNEVWFGALARPALPDTEPDPRTGAPVSRFADSIRVTMPEHVDGNAQIYGFGELCCQTSQLSLRRDGTEIGRTRGSVAQFTLSDGNESRYQLVLDAARDTHWYQDWWTTSTRTHTEWTFGSRRPAAGQYAVLPLLQVNYDLATDLRNQVPAHPTQPLTLTAGYQPGASGPKHFALELRMSFDDGETWREVPTQVRGNGTATVALPAAPDGAQFASLRVTARDRDGNQIDQTIERAYRIGR